VQCRGGPGGRSARLQLEVSRSGRRPELAPDLVVRRCRTGAPDAGVGRRTLRRRTAVAGPVPEGTMPRPSRSEPSQGQLPAYNRPAVPTREHQCGGQPNHCPPAHRRTSVLAHRQGPGPRWHKRKGYQANPKPKGLAQTIVPPGPDRAVKAFPYGRPAAGLDSPRLSRRAQKAFARKFRGRLDKPFHISALAGILCLFG
jgi:hypothetical protein